MQNFPKLSRRIKKKKIEKCVRNNLWDLLPETATIFSVESGENRKFYEYVAFTSVVPIKSSETTTKARSGKRQIAPCSKRKKTDVQDRNLRGLFGAVSHVFSSMVLQMQLIG